MECKNIIEFDHLRHFARERGYLRPFDSKEWDDYLKENPDLKDLSSATPDDLYRDGHSPVQCFTKSIHYAQRSLGSRDWKTYIVRKMMALMESEKRNTVLEYGCGAGQVGIMFAMMGYDVSFLDIKGVQTDFLAWRLNRRYLDSRVIRHDGELTDEKYDLVTLIDVLEHTEDPMYVLNRIIKTTKQGGYLILTFNSTGEGLDLVSYERWEEELKPFILKNYESVCKVGSLYRKK